MKFPRLGQGIGLRTIHYPELLDGAAPIEQALAGIDWLEIISENFFRPGGHPRRVLRTLRDRMPIVMHGVSLSLGSVDPLHDGYLTDLAALEKDLRPALVSDHLCWSGYGGKFAHDLLPLPFTEEALDHTAARIGRVQDRLRRQILVENVSSYLTFAHSAMTEWEFLSELAKKADCGLLLDVNNVFVSAHNHGFDARAFIAGVPADRVGQIHLAGHSTREALLLDTHDHAVKPEVWELYRFAIERIGPVSTLVEWDDKIPPLADVVAESRKAAAIVAEVRSWKSPDGAGDPRSASPGKPAGGPALGAVEHRLWDLISARESVPDVLTSRGLPSAFVAEIVDGDERLDAVGRINVYNSMYFLRLLDNLREDFPVTEAVLGKDGFYDLAADFVQALPPDKPSARFVGERLPEFLRTASGARPWLAELARLEWAIADVFDDRDAPAMSGEHVHALPPDRIAELPLRLIPAHRILAGRFAVQDTWRDAEKAPDETPTTILVWRRDLTIVHRALDADLAAVIGDLGRGTTFGLLCERLGADRSEEDAARLAVTWLGQWIGDGWLAAPSRS